MYNSKGKKYKKISNIKRKNILSLLIIFSNLSKKRADKAINRYNNSVDFANAHSINLNQALKGKATLVKKYMILDLIIQKLVIIYYLEFINETRTLKGFPSIKINKKD